MFFPVAAREMFALVCDWVPLSATSMQHFFRYSLASSPHFGFYLCVIVLLQHMHTIIKIINSYFHGRMSARTHSHHKCHRAMMQCERYFKLFYSNSEFSYCSGWNMFDCNFFPFNWKKCMPLICTSVCASFRRTLSEISSDLASIDW